MQWLKNVILDIAVTVLIVLAATLDVEWARWIVLIYTPFMLILKILFVLGGQSLTMLRQSKKIVVVPNWFYHTIYAVNVIITAGCALAGAGAATQHWWMLAGGWALIWILSVVGEMRTRPVAMR